MAYLEDPTFASIWDAKHFAGVPRIWKQYVSDLGGTDKDTIMASSWMGLRFPGLETIPCAILVPDQI